MKLTEVNIKWNLKLNFDKNRNVDVDIIAIKTYINNNNYLEVILAEPEIVEIGRKIKYYQ